MKEMDLLAAKAWLSNQNEAIQDLPYWETMSDDQLVAMSTIGSGVYDCIALLGRGGSGKTFIINAARTLLKMQGHEVRVCASTGVAARNAQGEGTLNKFAGLRAGGSTLPAGMRDFCSDHWIRVSTIARAEDVAANFDPREKCDLVVFIDEMSMVSSEDLVLTYQVIKRCCPNRRVRFVLTGDFRQLLIIDKQENLPWQVFNSLAFEQAKFHQAGSHEDDVRLYGSMLVDGEGPFELERRKYEQPWRATAISLVTNHRQKSSDGWFVEALNEMGDGNNFNHPKVSRLLSRVWTQRGDDFINFRSNERLDLASLDDAIHLFNTNKEVADHNKVVLQAAKQRGETIRTYTADMGMATSDNESLKSLRARILKEVAPLSEEMTLATGLKFMVRVNISEKLVNGTVGIIKKLEPTRIQIELPDGELHWISPVDVPLPVGKKGKPIGKFRALPGVLCHSMTPWKCQGLTINEPLVYHLNSGRKTHGLLYVVCSRVTNPEYLHILCNKPNILNKVVHCEHRVKQFITKAEIGMFRALGQKVYPAVWSDAGDSKVWVRDHLLMEVEYVANPKASILSESETCVIYQMDNILGMCVKDRAAMGELLLNDDEAFTWIKDNVQFVWFTPDDLKVAA